MTMQRIALLLCARMPRSTLEKEGERITLPVKLTTNVSNVARNSMKREASGEQHSNASPSNGLSKFRRHLRLHLRAHQCPECPKRFAYNKDVTRHMRTKHSSLRPFKCPFPHCKYAEKGFKRQDHLDRHRTTVHLHIEDGELPNDDLPTNSLGLGVEQSFEMFELAWNNAL